MDFEKPYFQPNNKVQNLRSLVPLRHKDGVPVGAHLFSVAAAD